MEASKKSKICDFLNIMLVKCDESDTKCQKSSRRTLHFPDPRSSLNVQLNFRENPRSFLEMHTAASMFAAVRAVLVLVRSNKYIS